MLKPYIYRLGLSACLLLTPAAYGEIVSPALSNWVSDIINTNPQVQAGMAALDAAQAKARSAGQSLYNPELELDFERTDIDTRTASISQTIDWFDKRGAQSSASEFSVQAAIANLALVRQERANELLARLSAFQTAKKLEDIANSRSELMDRFVDLSEQRFKSGDIAKIELTLARLAAAEAHFQRSNGTSNKIAEQQALSAIAGNFNSSLPVLPKLPPAINVGAINKEALLSSLPTVIASRANIDALRSAAQLQLRNKRPDPTLGLHVGKEADQTLTGVTISIPLFVRNTYQADVDVADAELIQAQKDAENVWRRASAQIEATSQQYQLLRSGWLLWEQSGKESLDQQSDILERLWQADELSTTDYLVQVKQALDTQGTAIEQHGQVWLAWSNWLMASGQTNKWLKLSGEQQ
ncbi:MAG: TolC family protein [Gallionella sp.]